MFVVSKLYSFPELCVFKHVCTVYINVWICWHAVELVQCQILPAFRILLVCGTRKWYEDRMAETRQKWTPCNTNHTQIRTLLNIKAVQIVNNQIKCAVLVSSFKWSCGWEVIELSHFVYFIGKDVIFHFKNILASV